MFSEYLKEIKSAPCLRLDIKGEIDRNKQYVWLLGRKFPDLFSECNSTNVWVPEGWKGIVESLLSRLNDLGVKVTCIKQKFGELRVHTLPLDSEQENEKANAFILIAESMSKRVCEFCGSTDKVSLWERNYVARVCINCKEKIAEYNILSWILEDNREWDERRAAALLYNKEVLVQTHKGTMNVVNGSFYDSMARFTK